MDLLVPADGVLQPLFLRETQHRFNLRAYVSLADSLVQVSHKYDGGNLLHQGAILCLQVGKRSFRKLLAF